MKGLVGFDMLSLLKDSAINWLSGGASCYGG